jgi:hypothetical protein
VIRPAANYDTERPNDHKFFSEFSIFEKYLSTIFVTAAIGSGETNSETGLPSIDYLVCSKIRGKALRVDYE